MRDRTWYQFRVKRPDFGTFDHNVRDFALYFLSFDIERFSPLKEVNHILGLITVSGWIDAEIAETGGWA